jgi:hypothetical protein
VYSHALPRGFLGVVEEYHRMTPRYQFVYLDIQELWPTSDETLAQEIARVTPASYG